MAIVTFLIGFGATTPVAAQSGPNPDYRAPRTADGQPDISGIWTNLPGGRLAILGATRDF